MVGDLCLLRNSEPLLNSNGSVNLPNDNVALINQLGSVSLSSSITLHDVLHIPEFQFNLLSISKFTKSRGCSVAFYSHFCLFQDLKSGKLWGLVKKEMDSITLSFIIL